MAVDLSLPGSNSCHSSSESRKMYHRILGKWIWLFVIVCAAKSAIAQPVMKQVVLRGQIRNAGNNHINIGRVNLLHLPVNDTVLLDGKGQFEKRISIYNGLPCAVTISHEEELSFSFEVSKVDTLNVSFDAKDWLRSATLNTVGDPLNQFLTAFQTEFLELESMWEDSLSSITAIDDQRRAMNRWSDMQFTYLRTHARGLDSAVYKQLSSIIFYRNMLRMLRSGYLGKLDYSAVDFSRFPPFPQKDMAYDRMEREVRARVFSENPATDTTWLNRGVTATVFTRWRAVYQLFDSYAFDHDVYYKNFLHRYMTGLAMEMKLRGMPKDVRWNLNNMNDWLSSLVTDRKFIDFVLGCELYERILGETSEVRKRFFDTGIQLIQDSLIKRELTAEYYSTTNLQPGLSAPPIEFLHENGKNGSLAQFKGKYVYVNFWDASCSPCISDIQSSARQFQDKFGKNDVVVLHVSLDRNPAVWKKAIKAYSPAGINVRMKDGWDGTAAKLYRVRSIPRHIIVTPKGEIRDAFAPTMNTILNGANPFQ